MLKPFNVPGLDIISLVESPQEGYRSADRCQSTRVRNAQSLAQRQMELRQQAIANMRELAEMATKSQTEAYSIIQKRMQERMEEIARPRQGKQTPAPAKK